MTDAPFTETHRTFTTTQMREMAVSLRDDPPECCPAHDADAAMSVYMLTFAAEEIDRLQAENTQLREELDAVQSDIDEGRQR